jgi:hypothetical protein
VKHLSDVPLQVRLLAILANIILGWKGIPGEKQSYLANLYFYVCKKF